LSVPIRLQTLPQSQERPFHQVVGCACCSEGKRPAYRNPVPGLVFPSVLNQEDLLPQVQGVAENANISDPREIQYLGVAVVRCAAMVDDQSNGEVCQRDCRQQPDGLMRLLNAVGKPAQ